jgi:hypothetical protein
MKSEHNWQHTSMDIPDMQCINCKAYKRLSGKILPHIKIPLCGSEVLTQRIIIYQNPKIIQILSHSTEVNNYHEGVAKKISQLLALYDDGSIHDITSNIFPGGYKR